MEKNVTPSRRRFFGIALAGTTALTGMAGCAEVGQITGALSSQTVGSFVDLILSLIPGVNTAVATIDAGITAANAAGLISTIGTALTTAQSVFLVLAGALGLSASAQAAETAVYNNVTQELATLSAGSPITTIGDVLTDAIALISSIVTGAQSAGAVPTSTAVSTPTPTTAGSPRAGAIKALNIQFQKQYS